MASIDLRGVFDYVINGYLSKPLVDWLNTDRIQRSFATLTGKYPIQHSIRTTTPSLAKTEEGEQMPIAKAVFQVLLMQDILLVGHSRPYEPSSADMTKVHVTEDLLHQSIATYSMLVYNCHWWPCSISR